MKSARCPRAATTCAAGRWWGCADYAVVLTGQEGGGRRRARRRPEGHLPEGCVEWACRPKPKGRGRTRLKAAGGASSTSRAGETGVIVCRATVPLITPISVSRGDDERREKRSGGDITRPSSTTSRLRPGSYAGPTAGRASGETKTEGDAQPGELAIPEVNAGILRLRRRPDVAAPAPRTKTWRASTPSPEAC